MEIKDHVCSFELALKLKEMGVPQESLFYWYQYSDIGEPHVEYHTYKPEISGEMACSAFTLSEFGKMIRGFSIFPFELLTHLTKFHSDINKEEDIRARILIYLIENT